jgi:hypothetical protein
MDALNTVSKMEDKGTFIVATVLTSLLVVGVSLCVYQGVEVSNSNSVSDPDLISKPDSGA